MNFLNMIFGRSKKYQTQISTKQKINFPKEIQKIEFPKGIIGLLETKTGKKIDFLCVKRWFLDEKSNSYNEKEVKENGISVRSISGKKARRIFHDLYKKLKKKGYLIFLTNRDLGYENPEIEGSREVLDIAIIKANDPYEIVKLIGTDGQNYNKITNDVLISNLKKWEKFTTFRIRVVDSDYIEAEILKLPSDIDKFAKKIFKLAPDTVHQGSGTLKKLSEEIKKEKFFWLWWD